MIQTGIDVEQCDYSHVITLVNSCSSTTSVQITVKRICAAWTVVISGETRYVIRSIATRGGVDYYCTVQLVIGKCGQATIRSTAFGTRVTATTSEFDVNVWISGGSTTTIKTGK